MSKTVIVNEGKRGLLSSERGDYDGWVKIIQRNVSESADVVTVTSFGDVIPIIDAGGVDMVIFVSGSMIGEAQLIKRTYPEIKAILLTGLYDWEEESDVIVIETTDTERIMQEISSVSS